LILILFSTIFYHCSISNSNKTKLNKEMLNYFVKTQYLVKAEVLWQKSDSIMEDCYKQHGENNNTDDNLAVNCKALQSLGK